ncbi:MAG: NAD-dependent epimerase/dehydratase family protein [Candidatus Omnitrophota bacterium]
MQPQSIFLTGSTGKIGRFLLKELLAKDYKITVLQREAVAPSLDPKIKFISGSLLDSKSYASSLDATDTVLHMAAITHTNKISDYYDINAYATLELLKLCKSKGVKRFIFISTRAISGEGGHYSKSKLMAEDYVRESGIDWVIMRLGEVYGFSGKTGVDMILNNIQKFPFIPIIGSGEYKMAPVHITDVVSSMITVIENNTIRNKIYNIAGPETFTYRQFVEKVLELKHLKKPMVYIPLPVFRLFAAISSVFLKNSSLTKDQIPRLLCEKSNDISLAASELSFRPQRLEEAISRQQK